MIISLVGYKGVGKDTTALFLIKNFGFIQYSFALPVKKALCEIFNWDMSVFEYPTKEIVDEKYGISPRQAMITLGTDYAQHMLCNMFPKFKEITGNSIWVQKFISFVSSNNDKNIVISDTRFHHEVKALKDFNATFVRISNKRILPDLSHESEKYVSDIKCDFEIRNDSTIEQLDKEVKIFYSKLL